MSDLLLYRPARRPRKSIRVPSENHGARYQAEHPAPAAHGEPSVRIGWPDGILAGSIFASGLGMYTDAPWLIGVAALACLVAAVVARWADLKRWAARLLPAFVALALLYGGASLGGASLGWWWPIPDIWRCTLKPHAPGCPDAVEKGR